MSREKQIEEMAKITKAHCKLYNQCGSCHWETCNECLAEILYKAGYRKQSEGSGIKSRAFQDTISAINVEKATEQKRISAPTAEQR